MSLTFRKLAFRFTPRFALAILLGIQSIFLIASSASAATPVITNIVVSNQLTNSATISWNTDIPADTQIEYGLTTAYGLQTTLNTTLALNHSQNITGLTTNQLYNYRVKSKDTNGDLAVSSNRTLITPLGTTTPGSSTDSSNSNTINTTRFTTVAGGAVASLSVHVGAVDANVNNRSFQLGLYTASGSVPGTLIANTASGTLVANAWNTLPITATLAPNTSYFIGYNTNGLSSSVNNMHYASGGTSGWRTGGQTFGSWPTTFGAFSTQGVTFSLYASFVSDSEPPTVSITDPLDSATVSGVTTISADATDNEAVASVQFKLGGNNLGVADTSAPYSTQWDTSFLLDGPQTLTAVATDTNGNSTTSSPIIVNTNNPSKVLLTQPTTGQNISATTFDATYNRVGDWSSGQHVHFRLDGGGTKMDLNSDGNQSYTFIDVPGGQHSLEYIVADSSHVELSGSGGTVTFSTTAPDTTPPTVNVTSPTEGAIVQNTVTVTADAFDETSLVDVQFLLDGSPLGPADPMPPFSTSWNTTTTSNGAHVLTARARDSLNQTTSVPVNVTVQNTDPRAVTGEWGPLMNWPGFVPVHATLMHTGEILMWDAWDQPNTDARLWNYATNTWLNVPLNIPNSELFCAGQATGATGELIVMGGHSDSGTLGTKKVYAFNPVSRTWINKQDMTYPRWYPSVTQMADNRMVTFSGQGSGGAWSDVPEVFNPTNNTVTSLPFSTPELHEIQYPQTSLLPNGKIITISAEHGGMLIFDPSNNSKANIGTMQRPYGVWTSFAPGKYLITGGGTNFNQYVDNPALDTFPSQTTTNVLDMTSGSPVWSSGGNMNAGRSFHNVTMLPTGQALAVGGSNIISDAAPGSNATKTADLWDPNSLTWSAMANPERPRMYHSVSLLLPDGRVLSGGSGRWDPAPVEENAQIFSPPYMFQGTRPTITTAPSQATHSSTMDFVSPNAADIAKVSLVSLGSVTHTADWNQRFVDLSFSRNGDTLRIDTPDNANIAPENYYMVFLVNSAGVPSEAKIIRLVAAPDTTAPVISNVQSTNIANTSATITWATNEASDSQVEYGTTTAYGQTTTLDNNDVTSHSQNLSGLAPGTEYHYRVLSRDPFNNPAVSDDYTFTTTNQTNFSLGFNGTNQYVQVPHSSSLNITSNNITLEAWVKPGAAATKRIASKTNYELYTTAASGKARITWRLKIGGTFRSVSTAAATDLPLNQWAHVAGVYNGSTIKLYINGVQAATSNRTGNISSTTSAFRIASLPSGNNYFNGFIEEVRLSNTARYTTTFTPGKNFTPDANTRGLWKFNEGTGATAADTSGNNNTGTLTNNPTWSIDLP